MGNSEQAGGAALVMRGEVLPAEIGWRENGLVLPQGLSFEQWSGTGETLSRIDGARQWWIGDWVNYGEARYGEKYAQALGEDAFDYGTLRNAAWVASQIEMSRRRDNLSFGHHQVVAPLEPSEQDEWLDQAIANKWSVHELRRQIRDASREYLPAPEGLFNVIYADPPWRYGREQHTRTDASGGSETHYETLSVEEICGYEFKDGRHISTLAAEDAALFLWATSPLLPNALEVIEAWGFAYKASFVWDKVAHNVGYYNSVRHEFLLIATKGSYLPESKTLLDSVVSIERSEHSRKPERFYEIIEELYPTGSKLELFARREREGWTSIGLEVPVAA